MMAVILFEALIFLSPLILNKYISAKTAPRRGALAVGGSIQKQTKNFSRRSLKTKISASEKDAETILRTVLPLRFCPALARGTSWGAKNVPCDITVAPVAVYLPFGVRCEAPKMYFRELLDAVSHRPTALLRLSLRVLVFDRRFYTVLYHHTSILSRAFDKHFVKGIDKMKKKQRSRRRKPTAGTPRRSSEAAVKVLVKLFQKLVGCQGNALTCAPQSAEFLRRSLLQSFSLRLSHQRKAS